MQEYGYKKSIFKKYIIINNGNKLVYNNKEIHVNI